MEEGLTNDMLLAYMERTEAAKEPFLTDLQMAYYMVFSLWEQPDETGFVVLLNRTRRHLRTIRVMESSLWRVALDDSLLTEQEKNGKAAFFFMGHSHLHTSVTPSPEDIRATRRLAEAMEGHLTFLGHFITNGGLNWTKIQL